jgi:hypothetical protein
MKERCEYMQEVNSLCKDVEKETTPLHPTTTPPLPTKAARDREQLLAEEDKPLEGKQDSTVGPPAEEEQDSVTGSSGMETRSVKHNEEKELDDTVSDVAKLAEADVSSSNSESVAEKRQTGDTPELEDNPSKVSVSLDPTAESSPPAPVLNSPSNESSIPPTVTSESNTSAPNSELSNSASVLDNSPAPESDPVEPGSRLNRPPLSDLNPPAFDSVKDNLPSRGSGSTTPPASALEPSSPVSEPSSPSLLNPQLAELATEVKDLNVRFANVCLQAKQHYASLSKVLTASIKRHVSKRSSTRSQRVHYVKITGIEEQTDRKGLSRRHSSANESSSSGNRKSGLQKVDSASENSIQPQTTISLNNAASSLPSAGGGVGGAPTSKASVLATDSPNPRHFSRSISLSSGTDLDSDEIRSRVESEYRGIVLRSKSVDEYSDTEPRSKRRPKSAVIIEPNPDGETALVSELQLRNSGDRDGSNIRRRSMEINLNSLAKTGLLSPSNLLNPSPATSPAVYPRAAVRRRQRKFGSLSTLQPSNRSSVVSIDSLDPRTMISGNLQNNSYEFNSSIGSDLTMTQVSDLAHEQTRAKETAWNGNPLGFVNGRKRSVSMDVLNLGEVKGQLVEPSKLLLLDSLHELKLV